MNIVIKTRKQYPVSDEKLYELYKASYQQWLEAGVDAQWLHHTLESFKKLIGHTVIYVAIDESIQELLAMHCLNITRLRKGVLGFCLAVAPQNKKQGIATKLLQIESEQICQRGFNYMKGVTEVSAIWSVRWHLKNGYRIIGYSKGRAPYSDTYTFRLQLAPFSWRHPSTWLWNMPLAPITARCYYLVSYIAARLTHHRNGQLNWIGRVGKKYKVSP